MIFFIIFIGVIILSNQNRKRKVKVGSRRKGRELCVQALYQYAISNQDIDYLKGLKWAEGSKKPSGAAIKYFIELFDGTLEHLEEVEPYIKEFAPKYDQIMPIDHAVLRFSTYSLIFERDIPAVIIINEAIEITKTFGGVNAHKFINGVLDGIRKKLVEKGKRMEKE